MNGSNELSARGHAGVESVFLQTENTSNSLTGNCNDECNPAFEKCNRACRTESDSELEMLERSHQREERLLPRIRGKYISAYRLKKLEGESMALANDVDKEEKKCIGIWCLHAGTN